MKPHIEHNKCDSDSIAQQRPTQRHCEDTLAVASYLDKHVGIKGRFDAGVKFYDALEISLRLVNIGDVKSLAVDARKTAAL